MVKATAAASSEDEDGLLESAGGGDDAREPGATPQGTSVCESIALVIRGNLGPGALALPYAFARSGWIFGVVAILTVGAHAL